MQLAPPGHFTCGSEFSGRWEDRTGNWEFQATDHKFGFPCLSPLELDSRDRHQIAFRNFSYRV